MESIEDLNQNLLAPDTPPHLQQRSLRQRRFTFSLGPNRHVDDFEHNLPNLRASVYEQRYRSVVGQMQTEQNFGDRDNITGQVIFDQIIPNEVLNSQPVILHKKSTIQKRSAIEGKVKRELNHRIFKLNSKVQKCLYIFNLIFNTFFRLSLTVILILELLQKKVNVVSASVLLGLQGFCVLLYFMAMTKILFTKSSEISVFFQKQFYEKPYAQIFMDRVLRKHFTLYKFRTNFVRFINPCTDFYWNIKISLIRQQIFKRMEMILVGVPLLVCYAFDISWFDLKISGDDNQQQIDTGFAMSIVLTSQFFRLTVHYVTIYIFS